jgi:hypothetical protein
MSARTLDEQVGKLPAAAQPANPWQPMAATKCPKCGAGIPADYPACGYCREPLGKGAGVLPVAPHRRRSCPGPALSKPAQQRAPVGIWRQLVNWAWCDPFYAFVIVGLVLGVLFGIGAVVYVLLRGIDLREVLPYAVPGVALLLAAMGLAIAKRCRRTRTKDAVNPTPGAPLSARPQSAGPEDGGDGRGRTPQPPG